MTVNLSGDMIRVVRDILGRQTINQLASVQHGDAFSGDGAVNGEDAYELFDTLAISALEKGE